MFRSRGWWNRNNFVKLEAWNWKHREDVFSIIFCFTFLVEF